MHPHLLRGVREHYGIVIAGRRPRHLDTMAHHRFDHLISLCGRGREVGPGFAGQPRPIHESIPGPATAGDNDQTGHLALTRMAARTDTRTRHLPPILARATDPEVQQ